MWQSFLHMTLGWHWAPQEVGSVLEVQVDEKNIQICHTTGINEKMLREAKADEPQVCNSTGINDQIYQEAGIHVTDFMVCMPSGINERIINNAPSAN